MAPTALTASETTSVMGALVGAEMETLEKQYRELEDTLSRIRHLHTQGYPGGYTLFHPSAETLTGLHTVRLAFLDHVKQITSLVSYPEQKPLRVSPWIADGHCAMRVIEGSDPDLVQNRVAFIEKTPRVRVAPFSGESEDWKGWLEGPKGSGGGNPPVDLTYGFDPDSRAWCDEQLLALGYVLPRD